jgi:hypothetical protein
MLYYTPNPDFFKNIFQVARNTHAIGICESLLSGDRSRLEGRKPAIRALSRMWYFNAVAIVM